MKSVIVKYILQIVEQAIDAYVQSTATQLDDLIWKELKQLINDQLQKNL